MGFQKNAGIEGRLKRGLIGALAGLTLLSMQPATSYAKPVKLIAGGETRFYERKLENADGIEVDFKANEHTGHAGVELFDRLGLYGLAGVLASPEGSSATVSADLESSFLWGFGGYFNIPLPGKIDENPERFSDLTRGWNLRAESEYRRASGEARNVRIGSLSGTPDSSEFDYNNLYVGGNLSKAIPLTRNLTLRPGIGGGYDNTFGDITASSGSLSGHEELESRIPFVLKPSIGLEIGRNARAEVTGYFINQAGIGGKIEIKF